MRRSILCRRVAVLLSAILMVQMCACLFPMYADAASKKTIVYRVSSVKKMSLKNGKLTVAGDWRRSTTRKKVDSSKATKLGKKTMTLKTKSGCDYKMYNVIQNYRIPSSSFIAQVNLEHLRVYIYVDKKTKRVKKVCYLE